MKTAISAIRFGDNMSRASNKRVVPDLVYGPVLVSWPMLHPLSLLLYFPHSSRSGAQNRRVNGDQPRTDWALHIPLLLSDVAPTPLRGDTNSGLGREPMLVRRCGVNFRSKSYVGIHVPPRLRSQARTKACVLAM